MPTRSWRACRTGSRGAAGPFVRAVPYTEDNFAPEAFEEAAAVIKRLCRTAERYGAIVGIEPGVNHPIHDAQTFGELVEYVDSPSLGLVLDPTALMPPTGEADPVAIAREMLERFGDRVCACHLVDYQVQEGRLVRCGIGEGVLPVGDLLRVFNTACPWGFVITEFTEDDAIGATIKRYA